MTIPRIFVFILLVLVACKGEEQCKPQGKWYFNRVLRNYTITNTLENGYIEFVSPTQLKSNLFDESISYNYSFEEKQLVIDSEEQLTLKIEQCSADTIILEGELSYFQMQFLMTKKPNESKQSNIEDSNLY
jgi:hypothetical protein